MSILECEKITPTQALLHRQRIERMGRIGQGAVADSGIRLGHPPGVTGPEFERLRELRTQLQEEKAKERLAAKQRERLEIAIEAARMPRAVVVEDVNLCQRPAVLLETIEDTLPFVSVREIQDAVCRRYEINLRELLSHRRHLGIVRPRQIAMYLAKKLTTRSLPDIGRRFGGKDHTTVIHAVRKIEGLIAADQEIAREVEYLTDTIYNIGPRR